MASPTADVIWQSLFNYGGINVPIRLVATPDLDDEGEYYWHHTFEIQWKRDAMGLSYWENLQSFARIEELGIEHFVECMITKHLRGPAAEASINQVEADKLLESMKQNPDQTH